METADRDSQAFMQAREIATTAVQREASEGCLDAFRIDVNAIDGVVKAAKAMIPYCVKKAEDLRIMVDYLEGKITGNKAIERFNEEVLAGRRSGFIRAMTLPYTRPEGLRLARLENARNARAAYAVSVTQDVQDLIRKDHSDQGLGYISLSKKYG